MIKKILSSQLIKFGLVGFLNTAVDFGVFTLLTAVAGLGSTISHIISYTCGVLNSYLFNRTWTFKSSSKNNLMEFFKFSLVNLASLGLSTLVLNYLETGANLSLYLSKAGATICSMAINFIGSKLLVFKK